MKAVFIHTNCILRDSHCDTELPPEGWRLEPATLEAVRSLSGPDQLVIVYGESTLDQPVSPLQSELLRQVEAGGGQIDVVLNCPHGDNPACHCWGEQPCLLWRPAAMLELALPDSFVIADSERDLNTAIAAGVRPLMTLNGRTIAEVIGEAPSTKDFPIAPDLTTAVSYIRAEQDITQANGQPRQPAKPQPSIYELEARAATLPTLEVTSQRLLALRQKQAEVRIKTTDLARWLSFFVIGALGVTLGIAYLLTHLYRVQPFPSFIYWVTLQFIPRTWRGLLFIVIGVGVIWLAVRSFVRSDLYDRFQRFIKRMRER